MLLFLYSVAILARVSCAALSSLGRALDSSLSSAMTTVPDIRLRFGGWHQTSLGVPGKARYGAGAGNAPSGGRSSPAAQQAAEAAEKAAAAAALAADGAAGAAVAAALSADEAAAAAALAEKKAEAAAKAAAKAAEEAETAVKAAAEARKAATFSWMPQPAATTSSLMPAATSS